MTDNAATQQKEDTGIMDKIYLLMYVAMIGMPSIGYGIQTGEPWIGSIAAGFGFFLLQCCVYLSKLVAAAKPQHK